MNPQFEVPARKSELQLMRMEIAALRREVCVLSAQVALFWHPARDSWQRHTAPDLDGQDDTSPTLKLAVPPDGQIMRVTIDDSPQRTIRTYGFGNRLILKYCGPAVKVGLAVLAKTAGLMWEEIEAPPHLPVVLPVTPIPQVPKVLIPARK